MGEMSEWHMRRCGNEWRLCNGRCAQCPLTKIEYSTETRTRQKEGVKNEFNR